MEIDTLKQKKLCWEIVNLKWKEPPFLHSLELKFDMESIFR